MAKFNFDKKNKKGVKHAKKEEDAKGKKKGAKNLPPWLQGKKAK